MDSQSIFCMEQSGNDMDLNNYYKLPFCDEDVKQLKELDWMNDYMDEGLLNPSSPSSHSSSCHSPSSSTSSNAAPLITDRPDTPLIAVKLEDFSNDCELGDLSPPDLTSWSNWPMNEESGSPQNDDGLGNAKFIFEGDTAELTFDNEPPKIVQNLHDKVTLDRTLTSSIYDGTFDGDDDQFTVFVKDDTEENLTSSDNILSSSITQSAANNLNVRPAKVPKTITMTSNAKSVFIPNNSNNVFTIPTLNTGDKRKRATVVTSNGQHKTQIQIPTSTLHTILKSGRLITKLQQEGQLMPRIKIKTEPNAGEQCVTICQPQIDVQLPPTPTSSNTSDSECGRAPSPGSRFLETATASQLTAQMLTSPQRLTQSHGPLVLTEEEKRTLVAEGYSIPARLPLTKGEEKALKKVRRKIKNKISAQESRRKKKEYVEALEKKMEVYNQENSDLRRKLDSLETSNKSLLSQLRSLQTLVAGKMPKPSRTVTTQTSSCLMIFVLCFAVFLGGWYPKLSPNGNDMAPSPAHPLMTSQMWQSRVLDTSDMEGKMNGKMMMERIDNTNEADKVADETYESPKAGRIVMNDTGDSKMIRNTMEPMDAAAIIASRKIAVRDGKMTVDDAVPADDENKKFVVTMSARIKE